MNSLRRSPNVRLLLFIALLGTSSLRGAQTNVLYFKAFNGTPFGPEWTNSLPSPPSDFQLAVVPEYFTNVPPNYSFTSIDGAAVMVLSNTIPPQYRIGWSLVTNFTVPNFTLEVRFNTLTQDPGSSIDGFIELWLLDPTNLARFDFARLFSGGGGNPAARQFKASSSITSVSYEPLYGYTNDTWYSLVLQGSADKNIRARLLDSQGNELIGFDLGHTTTYFPSGFTIGVSQSVGVPIAAAPVAVAIDHVSLTQLVPDPASTTLGLFAALNIAGTIGGEYSILYSPILPALNWTPRTNIILTSSPFFWFDPHSIVNNPQGYYQVVPASGN